MIIDYSDEFKNYALSVFPKWKQLHESINNNECDSIRIVLGDIKTIITPEEIVKSFDCGKVSELYLKAQKMSQIKQLENMWYNEYDRSYEEIMQTNEISKIEEEIFN